MKVVLFKLFTRFHSEVIFYLHLHKHIIYRAKPTKYHRMALKFITFIKEHLYFIFTINLFQMESCWLIVTFAKGWFVQNREMKSCQTVK